MLSWADNFRLVFWVAVIPGLLSVVLLLFGVIEPDRHIGEKRTNPIRRENLKRLSTAYWRVVGIGAVFTLARFSEAFLVLRGREGGIPVAFVPLVMVARESLWHPVDGVVDYAYRFILTASSPESPDLMDAHTRYVVDDMQPLDHLIQPVRLYVSFNFLHDLDSF